MCRKAFPAIQSMCENHAARHLQQRACRYCTFAEIGSSWPETLTFAVVPRIASTNEISTSEWMVVPSRRRPAGWGFTEMNTYRSPGSPPFRPTLPSPLTRSLLPASTPAQAF